MIWLSINILYKLIQLNKAGVEPGLFGDDINCIKLLELTAHGTVLEVHQDVVEINCQLTPRMIAEHFPRPFQDAANVCGRGDIRRQSL